MALKILKEYVAIRNKAKRASLSVIIALNIFWNFPNYQKHEFSPQNGKKLMHILWTIPIVKCRRSLAQWAI